ncbi:MAG: NB-ARC domain-containing protein [Gloeotrichia echinulata IR180]
MAHDIGLSLDTINRFLNAKPVLYGTFEEICRKLNLDWKEISTPDFESTSLQKTIHTQESLSKKYQDWGTAVDVSVFYDRTQEMAQLESWILEYSCRLVTIFGMGGVGKTSLATKLAKQIQDEFDYLIWRSLEVVLKVLSLVAKRFRSP